LQHQDAGEARGNQRLVMGAFGHNRLTGGLEFPQEAMDRHGRNAIRWFDRWLKGIENGIDAEPAVRYYLMGDPSDPESLGNLWREADDWPPPSTATSYYLGPERRLTLDAPTERAPSTSYSYNPRDPVPTRGGANMMAESGPLDQRLVGERSDVLKFETAPLESAVEVVGRVAVELHVRTDVEDTDFTVKLIDVHPNGYEALILDGALRLRHREGIDQMVRAKPDEVYKIEVDLWSTAIAFNRGHKIAIHVSSSNYPRFEPHPNTWLAIADMETESVIARNRIYHDVRRPSRLVLPVTKVYDPPAPR
jgi:putative CocE/NonD family hydrolase